MGTYESYEPSTCSGPSACGLRQAQVFRPLACAGLMSFGLRQAQDIFRNSILGHRLDKPRQPWRARSTRFACSGPFGAPIELCVILPR